MSYINFYNLAWYENDDLNNIIYNHNKKKYNGYTPVDLNWIDKLVLKEHRYGYHRMFVFGIWFLLGCFVPFWFLFMFIMIQLGVESSDAVIGISFVLCLVIGILLEIIYQNSCDKIDYNYLVLKNKQMNLFNDFDIEYKFSNSYKSGKKH